MSQYRDSLVAINVISQKVRSGEASYQDFLDVFFQEVEKTGFQEKAFSELFQHAKSLKIVSDRKLIVDLFLTRSDENKSKLLVACEKEISKIKLCSHEMVAVLNSLSAANRLKIYKSLYHEIKMMEYDPAIKKFIKDFRPKESIWFKFKRLVIDNLIFNLRSVFRAAVWKASLYKKMLYNNQEIVTKFTHLGFIKQQQFLRYLLRLSDDRKILYEILKKAPSEIINEHAELLELKQKIIGHRLSLHGYEGMPAFLSTHLTKERYRALNPIQPNAANLSLFNADNRAALLTPQEHGDMFSVNACWTAHGFSVHFLRDKDSIHIIYVNRGEERFEAAKDDMARIKSVEVYTIPAIQGDTCISSLQKALSTHNRSIISEHLQNLHGLYRNDYLSDVLKKKYQTVGNCTVANANVTWHLRLASEYMKKNPDASFQAAYWETSSFYKTMRRNDRIEAFKELLNNRGQYEHVNYSDAVLEALAKFFKPSLEMGAAPDRDDLTALLEQLTCDERCILVESLNQATPSFQSEIYRPYHMDARRNYLLNHSGHILACLDALAQHSSELFKVDDACKKIIHKIKDHNSSLNREQFGIVESIAKKMKQALINFKMIDNTTVIVSEKHNNEPRL